MFDAKSLLDSLVNGVSELGDRLQNIQPGEVLDKARDAAGDALDQATSGVKEVASKAIEATGADEKLDAVVGKVSGGRTSGDLLEQAKDIARFHRIYTPDSFIEQISATPATEIWTPTHAEFIAANILN